MGDDRTPSHGSSQPPPSLTGLLRRRAAADPDGVAAAVDGGYSLTYADWERRAEAGARGLIERGVSAGERVVLLFDRARWVDYAVAYMATLAVGAVAVPLAPRLARVEVGRIVADCGASGIVGPADLVPPGSAAWWAEVGGLEGGAPPGPLPAPAAEQELAEILYRPATMSPAQGQARTHGEIGAGHLAALVGRGERPAPLLHAFAVGSDAGQQALRLPLHLPGAASMALAGFDPDRFWEAISAGGIEAVGLPGPVVAAMAAGAPSPPVSSRLRVVITGSSVPAELRERLRTCFPAASIVTLGSPAGTRQSPRAFGQPAAAPLHPSQDGMLWHEMFAPGSLNLPPLVRRYRGKLDVGALERALVEIVRRHAPLRSNFEVRDGEAVQVPGCPLERVPLVDLSHLPADEQEAEVNAAISRAATQPFDLVRDPLFAPVLLRLGEEDHLLVVRLHHIVYDDWCGDVFRRELSALYTAFLGGRPSPLPALAVEFADHCRAHHARLAGSAGADQLSWWRRELAGAPLAVQLPVGDPDVPEGTPLPASEPQSLEVPAQLAHQLRALARGQRATTFMTVLAAAGVLLSRYTGQDDLVVATVVANRNRTELEGLIASFSKKVPLRLRLTGDPSFVELVGRARQAVLGAWSHQDVSYEAVVQDVLGGDAARHGLVPSLGVMFQAQGPQRARLELPGLVASPFRVRRAVPTQMHYLAGGGQDGERVPGSSAPWGGGLYLGTFVNLTLVDDGEGLSFVARGVFHPPRVARLLAHLRGLLVDVVRDPTRRVSELDMGDDDETDGLLLAPADDEVDLRGFRLRLSHLGNLLSRCPGVSEAGVELAEDPRGSRALVARVVPEQGARLSLDDLRAFLWSLVPGLAWPAEAVFAEGAEPAGTSLTPEEQLLASWWAQARGAGRVGVAANYWQDFTFADVVDGVHEAGTGVAGWHVARCRTVQMLACALRAQRMARHGTAEP